MKRKILVLLLKALVILGGCSSAKPVSAEGNTSSGQVIQSNQEGDLPDSAVSVNYDQNDLESSENDSEMSIIQLQDNSIHFEGSGVLVEGSALTITDAGTYHVSGSLIDGQIIVDAADEDQVSNVLDGVDIQSMDSSPINAKNADKVVISLASGSDNVVSDGDSYILEVLPSPQPAGTLIHIVSDAGIVVSSPELEMGFSYSIYMGGSATGTAVDGLYSSVVYSPGNLLSSFTISGIAARKSPGMMGGGNNPGMMGDGGRGRPREIEAGWIKYLKRIHPRGWILLFYKGI